MKINKYEWCDHSWGNDVASCDDQEGWFIEGKHPSVQGGSGMNDTSYRRIVESKEVEAEDITVCFDGSVQFN